MEARGQCCAYTTGLHAPAPLRSGSAPLRSLQKVDQPDHFFYSHADAMSPQC